MISLDKIHAHLDCAICIDKQACIYHAKRSIKFRLRDCRSIECGHLFCNECLQGYMKTADAFTCPICRERLSTSTARRHINIDELNSTLNDHDSSFTSTQDSESSYSTHSFGRHRSSISYIFVSNLEPLNELSPHSPPHPIVTRAQGIFSAIKNLYMRPAVRRARRTCAIIIFAIWFLAQW